MERYLSHSRLEADLTGDTLLGDWRHSDPSFIDSSY
jgi:hypothetical protein